MRQNFIALFIKHLKHLLCDLWSDFVMQKNWTFSIDQCQLQALQFLVNLINLLSILPRCNSYSRIQKVLVDRTISKPPNSDHDLFCAGLALGSALALLLGPTTELVIASCKKSTFLSHVPMQ